MLFLITLSDREEKNTTEIPRKTKCVWIKDIVYTHTFIQCLNGKKETSSQRLKAYNKEKTFYDNHNILKPDEPLGQMDAKWFQLIIYFYKHNSFVDFSLTVDVWTKLYFSLSSLKWILNFFSV